MNPTPLPTAAALAAFLLLASASSAADGPTLFADNCASCHGLDGKGRTPAGRKIGAKDLTESKLSDAAIAAQIANGTKDARGRERMPAFKDKLSPEEIAALVSHAKTLRH